MMHGHTNIKINKKLSRALILCYCFDVTTYEGKSLNNRKFCTRNNFFTRVFKEIVCVLFFDIVPLLRNTLGPPVHKLADAL